MPKRSNGDQKREDEPAVPRWKGSDSLDLVHRLNERSLQAISDLSASSVTCELPAVVRNRELWSTLRAEALKRAARLPFVVLDVQFANDGWWRHAISVASVVADESSHTESSFPAEIADPLIQETLIFAWHTVKWDQRVARLSLGMSLGVVESIAAVTPQQVATISKRHSRELQLRWQQRAEFWADLLRAAVLDDRDALEDIYLHAKLLLCGEVI